MYAVSEDFKKAVRQSHEITLRAEVYSGDDLILTLEPLDGKVDLDARRGTRRTMSLSVAVPPSTTERSYLFAPYSGLTGTYTTLASTYDSYGEVAQANRTTVETEVDPGLVPTDAYSALTPFGNEIRLWRGIKVTPETIVYPTYQQIAADYASYTALAAAYDSYAEAAAPSEQYSQVIEEVPLGVFVITEVGVETSGDGTRITINGSDRAVRITRSRWTDPFIIRNYSVEDGIAGLLLDRWLDVKTSLPTTGLTIVRATFGIETDNDPWKDAQSLAEAAGYVLYFDADGVATMTEVPDYATATPVAAYEEDEEAIVLSLKRSITVNETYNGVIATGEGSDQTDVYRGEAWDDDPNSATYRYGPFGEVPRFYSSPLIGSTAQAQAAAESILARSKGAVEQIEWGQIVDPSLDVGDVVQVVNSEAKISKNLVLDRISIPLNAAASMSAVARAVTFGAVE